MSTSNCRRQILALCITATNTFSSLLFEEGTSIPAFQSLANYVLLTIVYGSYTVYTYGIKKFGKVLWKDGWRYVILSFFDVVGNYTTVLAYRCKEMSVLWDHLLIVFRCTSGHGTHLTCANETID